MIDLVSAVNYLQLFGHLAKNIKPTEAALKRGLKHFQKYIGLPETGQMTAGTQEVMSSRRCGVSDIEHVATRGRPCMWGKTPRPILWGFDARNGYGPSLTQTQWHQAMVESFAPWQAVCNIEFAYTDDPRLANIIISSVELDRQRMGILAQAELPCMAKASRLFLQFDIRELFSLKVVPRMISVIHTGTHEIGHNIGISHIQPSEGVAMMNPTLNQSLSGLMPLDIREARENRYGPPPMPGPGPGPEKKKMLISITDEDGEKWSGEVARFEG